MFHAPPGLLPELVELSGEPIAIFEPFVAASSEPRSIPWAQNVWTSPRLIEVASISDAARKLRALERSWIVAPTVLHRRARLIADALPPVVRKPFCFGSPVPTTPLGAFTLLAPDWVLASPTTTSPFPNGELLFEEDQRPPSRAYLKLWETFTRIGRAPRALDRCLDAGASPGGWTWVLSTLGAQVEAIDRAPLDSSLLVSPLVSARIGDALSIDPLRAGPFDWVVSDVAVTPEKLLPWARGWIEGGRTRNLVMTLKFTGRGHTEIVREYLQLEGSLLFHGFHNKHELTLVWPAPKP